MAGAAKKLLEQALALPDEEREMVMLRLQASFEPDDEWEEAWATECDRRVAEYDAGEVTAHSWEEVRREVARAIEAARAG